MFHFFHTFFSFFSVEIEKGDRNRYTETNPSSKDTKLDTINSPPNIVKLNNTQQLASFIRNFIDGQTKPTPASALASDYVYDDDYSSSEEESKLDEISRRLSSYIAAEQQNGSNVSAAPPLDVYDEYDDYPLAENSETKNNAGAADDLTMQSSTLNRRVALPPPPAGGQVVDVFINGEPDIIDYSAEELMEDETGQYTGKHKYMLTFKDVSMTHASIWSDKFCMIYSDDEYSEYVYDYKNPPAEAAEDFVDDYNSQSIQDYGPTAYDADTAAYDDGTGGAYDTDTTAYDNGINTYDAYDDEEYDSEDSGSFLSPDLVKSSSGQDLSGLSAILLKHIDDSATGGQHLNYPYTYTAIDSPSKADAANLLAQLKENFNLKKI